MAAAVAVPPAAVVFARLAGAAWLPSLAFGAVAAVAVYLASRQRTTQEKAADLGRGVVVSLILTIGIAWVHHQGEVRSARDSLALTLSGGNSFSGIDLHDRDLSRFYLANKTFDGANLSHADLEGAVLRGASLRGANLRDADLSGADLREAHLDGARTDLSDARLVGANLELARLADAKLAGADLRDATLAGASLRGADLRGADLRHADLLGSDLTLSLLGADLRGAALAADYRPAKLVNAGLTGATWDETTRWPAGFDPDAAVAAAARPVSPPPVPADAETERVAKVVDGDTIVLEGLGVLRLLGIDAPQSETRPAECYADAATNDARRLLRRGSAVRVTRGANGTDDFGRALGYVWTADGRLANQELVSRGDARVLIVKPNVRYETALRRAQVRAAAANRGLWKSC